MSSRGRSARPVVRSVVGALTRSLGLLALMARLDAVSAAQSTPGGLMLDERCTVTVASQTVRIGAEGTFLVHGFGYLDASSAGATARLLHAQVTCHRDGATTTGRTELFQLAPGAAAVIGAALPVAEAPGALRLSLASSRVDLMPGETAQLTVTAELADGTTADATPTSTGTSYLSLRSELLMVDAKGRVTSTATVRGAVTGAVAALHQGSVAALELTVTGAPRDADGDGMEDELETFFGLDPTLDDAALDLDGDGLTNRTELDLGTSPDEIDTDADLVPDGLDGAPLDPES